MIYAVKDKLILLRLKSMEMINLNFLLKLRQNMDIMLIYYLKKL